jgi:hypothetical protein
VASALRDYRDAKGNDGDWVGALTLATLADDIRMLREAVVIVGQAMGALKVKKG